MSDPHLAMLGRRMAALDRDGRQPPPAPAPAPAPPPAPPEETWLTLEEAAKIYRVSVKTFRTWGVPSLRVGRIFRIRLTDLQDFVARRVNSGQNGGADARQE